MKVKFPIIVKMALLATLVSSIAFGASLTVSGVYQNKRSEETLVNNIDKSLYLLEFYYTEDDDRETLIDGLKNVREYVRGIYSTPEVHEKTINDFDSFQDYEAYFKHASPWIYPDPSSMIAFPEYLNFRQDYREICHLLLEAQLSSGVRAAYMCFTETIDDELRFVFMADSRMLMPNEKDPYYQVPASHYTLSDTDETIDNPNEEYYGYKLNGYLTRYVPIIETHDDGSVETIALAFLEYDRNEVLEESRRILLSELLILAIAMVINIIIYMVISYFSIVRNLNKLTFTTNRISDDLKNKKDITPKSFNLKSHDELSSLAASFEMMEKEIVNYVDIIKQEAKENERRDAELEVCNKIQLSALPLNTFRNGEAHLEAYIKPAKEVGGDFYDYFYHQNELVIITADVSGKGIPAALFMMRAKTLIKSKIKSGLSMSEAVKEVNNELTLNNDETLFVTAFIASINFQNNEIHYINAGHEKPYIIHQGKVNKLDGTSNFVLGGEADIEYIEEKATFDKGDILFAFTDGLNESINNSKEEFGYPRVEEVLLEGKDLPLTDMIDLINRKLKEFIQEEEQFDDITMILLENLDNKLHLSYKEKDYSIIEDVTDKFLKTYSFMNEEAKAHVGIALDELLNNLISYEEKEDLHIDLDFSIDGDDLKVVISSNGSNFNPFDKDTTKALPENDENIHDINPGGFGITLVKEMTKDRKYSYKNKVSEITLIFENK